MSSLRYSFTIDSVHDQESGNEDCNYASKAIFGNEDGSSTADKWDGAFICIDNTITETKIATDNKA